MGSLKNVLEGLKPVVVMVMVQAAYAGVNLAFKLAINDGMSMRIATAYRLQFASAFTLLLALLLERLKYYRALNDNYIFPTRIQILIRLVVIF